MSTAVASWHFLTWTAGDRIRTDDVQLGKLNGDPAKGLENQGDTNTPSAVVPKTVPSGSENVNGNPADARDAPTPLESLAKAIAGLSADDRAKLAEKLAAILAPGDGGVEGGDR